MHQTDPIVLNKTRPTAGRAADGAFQLTLYCYEVQGPLQKEPWQLIWTGEPAQQFWHAHAADLLPGTPLRVNTHKGRAHSTARSTEIVAHVISCEIAPARNTDKREKLSEQEQTA